MQPVLSVLQQCGVLRDDIDNIPTMLLPQPIATLLFAGAWSDLVCLARWRLRFWPEWPPQAWIQEVNDQHWRPRDAQTLSVAAIRSIAKDLRRWAPLIARPYIASQEGVQPQNNESNNRSHNIVAMIRARVFCMPACRTHSLLLGFRGGGDAEEGYPRRNGRAEQAAKAASRFSP